VAVQRQDGRALRPGVKQHVMSIRRLDAGIRQIAAEGRAQIREGVLAF